MWGDVAGCCTKQANGEIEECLTERGAPDGEVDWLSEDDDDDDDRPEWSQHWWKRGAERDTGDLQVLLVKSVGSERPDVVKELVPWDELSRKKRAFGFHHSKSQNVVMCERGHVMKAKVCREILSLFFCGGVSVCDTCGRHVPKHEAYYYCQECDLRYCTPCSREVLGLPRPMSHHNQRSVLRILAGDIFFCGPDKFGIHHVVLARGELKFEPQMAVVLQLKPGMEVYSTRTIESTQSASGEDSWWFPCESFFQRDPYHKTADLVADLPPESEAVNLAEEPVPLKVLLHPLRKEFGGPGFNADVFNEVVEQAADESRGYGWGTVVKAFVATTKPLEQNNYSRPSSREDLLNRLHDSWGRRPICASVAIKAWQMYFEEVCRSKDMATRQILQWMPFYCDATTPSAMLRKLTECGWVLYDSLDA